MTVLDSYAHHPTELAADLRAARDIGARRPGHRGLPAAPVQPHPDLRRPVRRRARPGRRGVRARCLRGPRGPRTGRDRANWSPARCPAAGRPSCPIAAAVPEAVADIARPGDLVLTMGAGDVTALGPLIVAALRRPGRCTGMSGSPAAHPPARPGGPARPVTPEPGPGTRPPAPAGPPWMGWKAAFFGLAAIAIAAAVAWALLGSRLLVVRSVQVTGTGAHRLAGAGARRRADPARAAAHPGQHRRPSRTGSARSGRSSPRRSAGTGRTRS